MDYLATKDIIIPAERQRREMKNVETLAESIKRNGQLEPIGVTREKVLVYGQRRLLAKRLLKHDMIAVVYTDELKGEELQALEFEENFYREGLPWQDEVLAVFNFDKMKRQVDKGWSQEKTGICIGFSQSVITDYLAIARALQDPLLKADISSCATVTAARNFLDRQRARAQEAEMYHLEQAEDAVLGDMDYSAPSEAEEEELENNDVEFLDDEATSPEEIALLTRPSPKGQVRPAGRDIFTQDFRKFAEAWDGPRFTFLHCDFPFGIGHDKSAQGASRQHSGTYEDSPDVYWNLLDALFENKERLISPNAHIMFWLSLANWEDTTKAFERQGFTVDPFPLIWYKSDMTSISPSPSTLPRRVYEAAMFIRQGDPKIVRSVPNLCPWPATKEKAKHVSEKPEPVLSHFFRMFVDQHSIVLDPTCGSGNALVAATSRWALRVVGMDIDPNSVETAAAAVNRRRLVMAGKTKDEMELEEKESDSIDAAAEELV